MSFTPAQRQRLLLAPVYIALVAAAAFTLIPFAWLLCAAFKTNADMFTSNFLPAGEGLFGVDWQRLTVVNFVRLFTELEIGRAMANSIFLSATSALLATFFCAMAGYALAKFRFPGREWVISLVLAALVIPGSLLLAPGYKVLYDLGLLDTYAGLLIPGVTPAFGVFLFRQSMINAVPTTLLESARIDGAGEFRIFFTIVLPLVRPMIGAFLMITFLGTWNNFIGPQIVLQDPARFPLSVAINHLRGLYGTDYGLIMSGTLISIAPVLALFLLLQKEFVAGLTSGAIKG
ncbi:MAG: carbohydrate ABC transporter permease [Verrucomicrobia bacterium]|nr:MAG: carbohydrate ABC transporter permease [Verrucomicrobiota bacterium]